MFLSLHCVLLSNYAVNIICLNLKSVQDFNEQPHLSSRLDELFFYFSVDEYDLHDQLV